MRGAAYRTERRSELRQIGLAYAQFYDDTPKEGRTLEKYLAYIKSAVPIRDAIKEGYYVVNLRADPTKNDSIIACERDENKNGHLCVMSDGSVDHVPAATLKKALAN